MYLLAAWTASASMTIRDCHKFAPDLFIPYFNHFVHQVFIQGFCVLSLTWCVVLLCLCQCHSARQNPTPAHSQIHACAGSMIEPAPILASDMYIRIYARYLAAVLGVHHSSCGACRYMYSAYDSASGMMSLLQLTGGILLQHAHGSA